ncbi:MAG TPA: NAD(P)-dependent oxidoreductase, partial [Candidatus Binatia bacterium]|nr:NAD(P)-dependent oxidoreductase [Candidatus Binatia bacterium]
MERHRIWIRVPIPDGDMSALRRDFPAVEFVTGGAPDPSTIDGVFTDDPVPEDLLARMPKLRWLHVTRGGANAYLTPEVKRRPIDVTGSKGIHGRSFSEFAIACIFALAKKLPECWENQKHKAWQRVESEEVADKTLGIVGLGTVGSELA